MYQLIKQIMEIWIDNENNFAALFCTIRMISIFSENTHVKELLLLLSNEDFSLLHMRQIFLLIVVVTVFIRLFKLLFLTTYWCFSVHADGFFLSCKDVLLVVLCQLRNPWIAQQNAIGTGPQAGL